MDRRKFIKNSLAGGLLVSSPNIFAIQPKDAIVIDAMGEIREVYTDSL